MYSDSSACSSIGLHPSVDLWRSGGADHKHHTCPRCRRVPLFHPTWAAGAAGSRRALMRRLRRWGALMRIARPGTPSRQSPGRPSTVSDTAASKLKSLRTLAIVHVTTPPPSLAATLAPLPLPPSSEAAGDSTGDWRAFSFSAGGVSAGGVSAGGVGSGGVGSGSAVRRTTLRIREELLSHPPKPLLHRTSYVPSPWMVSMTPQIQTGHPHLCYGP